MADDLSSPAPSSSGPIIVERPRAWRRSVIAVAMLAMVLLFAARSGALQAVLDILTGHQLPVSGPPVAATHPKLSEHNIEWLKQQPAQEQAEFLLSSAINHDEGATALIDQSVPQWRGQIERTRKWQDLETVALYSNDLRVRAAAIEINLAVNKLDKSDETAERMIEAARQDAQYRHWAAWELGMLANRGVSVERIHQQLAEWIHDPDQQTRFWSVEGLAHIGTDDTIANFLDVFRNDPSLDVRERAGCSLAKSGMMTREQRMKAVPGLLDLTDDPSLDPTTRGWIYQALREITDETLPNDPGAWRTWFGAHGAERTRQFSSSGSSVLGNS